MEWVKVYQDDRELTKAQEQLWKILETLSFNEIQKLADDLYTRKFTLIKKRIFMFKNLL